MIHYIKSDSNKNISILDILTTIDEKENDALETSPSIVTDKIKERFDSQRKEVQKIMPNIQDTFLTYTVRSFSFTFKMSAILLLPGILFALFSDKKINHDIKNTGFVKNIENV